MPPSKTLTRTERAPLYSQAMLEAAVSLAGWPLSDDFPLTGEARSRTCGSTAAVGLALDGEGRIARVGCRVQACAVGQSAAASFAGNAVGRSEPEVAEARAAVAAWLAGGPPPDWPGLTLIAPAIAYPARHGAILLAWDAALAALAPQPALR